MTFTFSHDKHTCIRFITGGAAAVAILLGSAAPAFAAKLAAKAAPVQLGNDISWPQCGKPLPSGQAFGVVSVNGGTAIKDNPCLSSELQWAAHSTGAVPAQKKIQLYVNTANPGNLGVASWPVSNTGPSGTATADPYGPCAGEDSDACAWQYGWNRAFEDVQNRFVPATQSLGLDTNPANYPWWLDVETVNSWESGSTTALARNAHDLEGMAAYFKSLGATQTGIYSTSYQWNQIVGTTVSADSNLNQTFSWLAGSSSKSAPSDCKKPPLTAGSTVAMTQYVSGRYDYDYSCL